VKVNDKRGLKKTKEEVRANRVAELNARIPEPNELQVRNAFFSVLTTLINQNEQHVGIDKTLDWIEEALAEWRKQLGATRLAIMTGTERDHPDA
jgi:hypothetical protein